MKEIQLNDISDELLIINKVTIEKLFLEKNQNVLILYLFYYKTAKWQKHNPIKANDEYCKKCLGWGNDKLLNAKKRLKEMGLISIEKRFDDSHKLIGWYVKLNYLIKKTTTPETTTPENPVLEKQETNTINNNLLNTNNNKIKEIYKEKFETFYSAYPKKVKKSDVEKWFYKNKPDDELFKTIMNKLEDYKTIWKNKDMQYIPYPTTWLNGKQWEDEIQRKQTYEDILAELDEMERRGEL